MHAQILTKNYEPKGLLIFSPAMNASYYLMVPSVLIFIQYDKTKADKARCIGNNFNLCRIIVANHWKQFLEDWLGCFG